MGGGEPFGGARCPAESLLGELRLAEDGSPHHTAATSAAPPARSDKRGRSREWFHIGLILGLCRAVLPCAPSARTQVGELASNWPSASTKAAGHGRGTRKVCENRRADGKAITLPFVVGPGAGGGRAGARPSRRSGRNKLRPSRASHRNGRDARPSAARPEAAAGAAKMAAPHVVRIRVISPNRGNDRGNVVADTAE